MNKIPQFNITSQSNFEHGFTVSLFVNGEVVGFFKYCLDCYDGALHSVEVIERHRRKGYGTALLLKTIETAIEYMGSFQSDSRGRTQAQELLYKKAEALGFIKPLGLGQFDLKSPPNRLTIEAFRV